MLKHMHRKNIIGINFDKPKVVFNAEFSFSFKHQVISLLYAGQSKEFDNDIWLNEEVSSHLGIIVPPMPLMRDTLTKEPIIN